MRIILETDERIRLLDDDEGFAFEAGDAGLSPFHLLASALATCTHSVLHGWAAHAGLGVEGLEIVVHWELGGEPVRVSRMDMEIVWPGLPPRRRAAANRAAALCTVHSTLTHTTAVHTRVAEGAGNGGGAAARGGTADASAVGSRTGRAKRAGRAGGGGAG